MSSVCVGNCSVLALYWLIKMPERPRLVKTQSLFSYKNVIIQLTQAKKKRERETEKSQFGVTEEIR